MRINDTATRYGTIRVIQEDMRVWPWRNGTEPFATTRTIDELQKGTGMVLVALPS